MLTDPKSWTKIFNLACASQGRRG